MEYIERTKSLLTGKANMEPLYTFRHFPVFMGCATTPESEDLFADIEWQICRDTGMIQLAKLLPLKILYLDQHNDGIGKTWQDLYIRTADFIFRFKKGSRILEIGGAHDAVARRYLELHPDATWTI